MKKPRLLCIPPYEGMYNLMKNIAAQRSDVELIIHMGNMEDGLQAVLDNRDNNIDAVISRGGTAETIRAHCGNIPSCDIIPSVFDILRTIRLAQSMSEKFAVVGYQSVTKNADMLRDIMQYDFKVCTIHSAASCDAALESLKNEGIQIIVGDMISASRAQEHGMHGLLIVSGLESVEAAIDSAVEMHRYYDSLSRRATILSDLVASEESDVIVFTPDGNEFFSSAQALPLKLKQLLRERVSNVIAQGSLKIMRHLASTTLSIQGRLLQSGDEDFCVYTISYLSGSADFDKHMIRCLSTDSDLPDCKPLEYYLGGSDSIASIQSACERFSAMSSPVLITGASGTGKDRFAHYIYAHSKLKHSSFVVIDVAFLDDKGWDFLLNSDNSPLTNSGLTIYIKNAQTAAPHHQQQFLIYLKNSCLTQVNRLIFAYTTEQGVEPSDPLYLYLRETMHCLKLHLPMLSQRPEDIPTLVGLYINAVNVQHGTRVIGLTHDAMLTLQNHSWPRNVDQLVQVVHDLVINANTSYIPEEQVRHLLEQEKHDQPLSQEVGIDLNRPLNEIIQDVVRRVYEANNMNQTHTAKHLGISRSTLWRMLK